MVFPTWIHVQKLQRHAYMSTAIRCRNFQLAQAYQCGQLNFQCQPNFYSSVRQAENHWSWPSFDWTTIAYLNLVGMLFGTMDHLNTQQLAQQLSSWGLDSWKVVPRCHYFKIVNFSLYILCFFSWANLSDTLYTKQPHHP